ncbi:MAG: HAD-IA family hydrolase [Candidatus Omnitrophica bacterium]|nr:HAD-IA family hydrolase [Candidatus Omnitrophota bacterium]MBD3268587.1 HAD-IA family hydrolase [Candidatus Omnitrophota bacterium]
MINNKTVNVKLIIFDLDGTLIDSRRDIVNAVSFTLHKFGIREKGFEEIISYVGTGSRDLIRKSLGESNSGLLDKAIAVFSDYFSAHCVDESRLYPHVLETLEFFKHKKIVLLTNRHRTLAEKTLELTGIIKYFDRIEGGDEVACLKPSGCAVEKILKGYPGLDKKEVMIVGDMDIDVGEGKKAGIITCGVTYGIGSREDIIKSSPDFIIDGLSRLKQIIK